MKKKSYAVLLADKEFVKDEIVYIVERMVKQNDERAVRGMTEVPMRYIRKLDQHLEKLQKIEHAISDYKI